MTVRSSLLLVLIGLSCRASEKHEVGLNETFAVWRWDCAVLDAKDVGKQLSAPGSDVRLVPSRSTSHFDRLHVRCKSSRFSQAANMAPTVLSLDPANPSPVYATLVVPSANGDPFLDAKTQPPFHRDDGGVPPGGTREYWTITEVSDALLACVFASGPSPDADYPRVVVRLPE